MQNNQVALVWVGPDLGCLLNGQVVTYADPGCGDDVETVSQTAHSLAGIHGVDVLRIDYAGEHGDWNWDEVVSGLQAQGKIVCPGPSSAERGGAKHNGDRK